MQNVEGTHLRCLGSIAQTVQNALAIEMIVTFVIKYGTQTQGKKALMEDGC